MNRTNGNVVARTDHGYAGWWCTVHECLTGERGWCPWCDRDAEESA